MFIGEKMPRYGDHPPTEALLITVELRQGTDHPNPRLGSDILRNVGRHPRNPGVRALCLAYMVD
jgi:hypothetical protein